MKIKLILALCLLTGAVKAQEQLQYFRPNDLRGVNTFETSKKDTVPFTGLKVKLGGNFEMEFQGLRNFNTATPMTKTGFTGNVNSLETLTNGFALPMARGNFRKLPDPAGRRIIAAL